MNVLQWFNFGLCAAIIVVAFFVAVRMRKETEPQIVLSFATIGGGVAGAMLGYFRPGEWQAAFDTLLYGGVLALMIGSRKNPNWVAPRWIKPIAVSVAIGTWLAFFVGIA